MGCGCNKRKNVVINQISTVPHQYRQAPRPQPVVPARNAVRPGVPLSRALPPKPTEVVVKTSGPSEWGPYFWVTLHTLAEKMGRTANILIANDQLMLITAIIESLPIIIPCKECQAHCQTYISANPISGWKSLKGEALRNAVRSWLFLFHSTVRAQTKAEIVVKSEEECKAMYENKSIGPEILEEITKHVIAGTQNGIVRIENWKRWVAFLNRLMLLLA